MNKISLTLFLFLIPTLAPAQETAICKVLDTIYFNRLQKEYHTIYISDSLSQLDFGPKKQFLLTFRPVPRRTLKMAFTASKRIQPSSKLNCFDDSLVGNKNSLIKNIRKININPHIEDSPYIKIFLLKESEILKINDVEKRIKLLNELTLTQEFKKYNELIDFNTPRVVEFSKPLKVKDYLFIMFEVMINHSDNRYSLIYVYKKDGNDWKLLINKNSDY